MLAALYALNGEATSVTATQIRALIKLHLGKKTPTNISDCLRKAAAYVEPAEAGPPLKWRLKSEGVSRLRKLDAKGLQKVFSLGLDDIDLVTKSIPGKKKKERMHNVLLLKGIAAYLGTGAARISHEQFKEACIHYDAYDVSNFAAYMNSFAAEAGGTKETGYSLTARGLAAGTELLKSLIT